MEMHQSEIFKVIGWIEGDSKQEGFVIKFDAVEVDGETWLVPNWKISADGMALSGSRVIAGFF